MSASTVRGAVLDDGSQFWLPRDVAANVQFILQIGSGVVVKGYGTANQSALVLSRSKSLSREPRQLTSIPLAELSALGQFS
jgi:hypothetical protein